MSEISIYQAAWVLMWGLMLGACISAIWKGGAPERDGAILILSVSVLSPFADSLIPADARLVGRLVSDGLVALGFLVISIRYASLWLGGALIAQAVQFSLQAFYFVTERDHDAPYAVVNNLNTVAVLAFLVAGTIAYQRRLAAWRVAKAKYDAQMQAAQAPPAQPTMA